MWYVRLAARPTMVESEAVLLMVLHPVLLWEVLEAVQREFHPEALPREGAQRGRMVVLSHLPRTQAPHREEAM